MNIYLLVGFKNEEQTVLAAGPAVNTMRDKKKQLINEGADFDRIECYIQQDGPAVAGMVNVQKGFEKVSDF